MDAEVVDGAAPVASQHAGVSSTLHQKIKYPSEGQIEEILGDQTMARQCMIAAIRNRPEVEPATFRENEL